MSDEVTARDFGRLEGRFDALDAKLDSLIEGQRESQHQAEKFRDQINARLARIEHSDSFREGKNTILGTLGGLVGGAIVGWFARHF